MVFKGSCSTCIHIYIYTTNTYGKVPGCIAFAGPFQTVLLRIYNRCGHPVVKQSNIKPVHLFFFCTQGFSSGHGRDMLWETMNAEMKSPTLVSFLLWCHLRYTGFGHINPKLVPDCSGGSKLHIFLFSSCKTKSCSCCLGLGLKQFSQIIDKHISQYSTYAVSHSYVYVFISPLYISICNVSNEPHPQHWMTIKEASQPKGMGLKTASDPSRGWASLLTYGCSYRKNVLHFIYPEYFL